MAIFTGTALVLLLSAVFANGHHSAKKLDCYFTSEAGLCNFKHDVGVGTFNFTRRDGKTPSPYTGPQRGSYLYIETSYPRLNKEKCRLISPSITRSDGNCLFFRYHMYGLNIGELRVLAKEEHGSERILWGLRGDQGNKWREARVPINIKHGAASIRIIFEGLSGASYMGDAAFTNVTLTKCRKCRRTQPRKAAPRRDRGALKLGKCGVKPPASRIVGGVEAEKNEWPWMAMLTYQLDNGQKVQFCGATLVHRRWVVTAAHCVEGTRPEDYHRFQVRFGEHERNTTAESGHEEVRDISDIISHECYNEYPVRFSNDIALIKLKSPVNFNNKIRPACLPNGLVSFPPGTECYITGWGTLASGGNQPDVLQEAKTKLISQAECTKNGSYPANEIDRTMVCAQVEGIDSCQGDSGGPLVCKNKGRFYLTGVVSWGYGCAHPNFAGVYANVPQLKRWVFRKIKGKRWRH